MKNISLSIILGTRPEIIKMSPVVRECEKRGLKYFMLQEGRRYSYDREEYVRGWEGGGEDREEDEYADNWEM